MKNRYDLEAPDLTPDLVWMLSSGQVSSALLLEHLLQEYYPKIFQLAFSILDDRASAGRAARQVFVEAMLAAQNYANVGGVDVWFYKIAWKGCQKEYRKRKAHLVLENIFPTDKEKRPGEPAPLDPAQDPRLWQAVDALGELPRWALILNLLHGWPVEMVSQVLGASPPEVEAALNTARQAVSAGWLNAGVSEAEYSAELMRLFSLRWPALAANDVDLDELAAGIGKEITSRKRRIKPVATFLEVSLLAVVVLVAGGFLIWAGRGEKDRRAISAVGLQVTPSREAESTPSVSPAPGYRYRSTRESLQTPRSYDLIPAPTSTPTPAGVLYSSQEGEELTQIASRLGVSLDELRQLNRIHEDEKVAHGQYLYIPGSLPQLTLRRATAVPEPVVTLPLKTPASSEDIAKLLFPGDPTYTTVWFDAVLYMHQQLPFSDTQGVLRMQLWISDDQVLLIGGPLREDPREVILQDRDKIYIARPGEASPWFQPADDMQGDILIDPRLIYGAMALLRRPSSYGYQKYQLSGDESIVGRPAWKIAELDDQMSPVAEISIDKETGFILKYTRNQENGRDSESQAFLPVKAMIVAIEYNVDFPQELFNPRLPWRGGYAWDHSAAPQPAVDLGLWDFPW